MIKIIKISQEVDGWNPLSDLVPIHAWIHPWLPKLGIKHPKRAGICASPLIFNFFLTKRMFFKTIFTTIFFNTEMEWQDFFVNQNKHI